MGITTKTVLVKVHWSIRKVERYYIVLCCVYQIISEELLDLNKKMALQIYSGAILRPKNL